MTPNEKLGNLHANSEQILRKAFADVDVRLAFATLIATQELDSPEQQAKNPERLREVICTYFLDELGVNAPLIEAVRMQILQERQNVVPFTTRRQ